MLENNGLAINRLNALGAALNLSFVGGEELNSRITFTRASGATRFKSNGLMEVVGNDVARFDYDPATLQSRGLLIEESRTNLLLQSSDISNGAGRTYSACSGVANQTTSPTGAADAALVKEDASNSYHFIQMQLVGTISTTYTASVFVKAGARQYLWVEVHTNMTGANDQVLISATLNLSTLAVTNTNGVTTITPVGGGWYRIVSTCTTAASLVDTIQYRTGLSNANSIVSYAGDNTSGFYLYGAQLEVGSFATSYIPTTSAAVTRAGDTANITGTNFSSWYNSVEGTFICGWIDQNTGSSGASGLLSVNDGSGNNKYDLRAGSGHSIASGGSGWILATGTPSAGIPHKMGLSYIANAQSLSRDGVAPATGVAAVLPPGLNAINLGRLDNASSYYLNGHIRSLIYYNTRLSDTKLQALTL